jgi:hypothetical protein
VTLHCPARLIVAYHEGGLDAWVQTLRDRRVAAVYTSPVPDEVARGEAVAGSLGAAARVAAWLERLERLDGLAAEARTGSVPQGVRCDDEELRSLADLHRGETVLLLVPATAAGDTSVFELEIGDDGARLLP